MITLKKRQRPPADAFNISIHDVERKDGSIKIWGNAHHIRSNKTSPRFCVFIEKIFDYTRVVTDSPGYMWSAQMDVNMFDEPEDVIKAVMRMPIMTAVMFNVSCNRENQHAKVNAFLGSHVYDKCETQT